MNLADINTDDYKQMYINLLEKLASQEKVISVLQDKLQQKNEKTQPLNNTAFSFLTSLQYKFNDYRLKPVDCLND
jgi:flagellar basal body rod protein FlgB